MPRLVTSPASSSLLDEATLQVGSGRILIPLIKKCKNEVDELQAEICYLLLELADKLIQKAANDIPQI